MRTIANNGAPPTTIKPAYLPLVDACAQHGIGRTEAFRLVSCGLLDTFTIGRKRFVRLASLETLPDRLQQPAANDS